MRALESVTGWEVGAATAGVLCAGSPSRPVPGAPRRAGSPGNWWRAGEQGATDRPFAWASLTKLCTALAALVASEEGTLPLAAPCGPPGATVAHLLAHASGLGPDGERILSAPGQRRIYSNAGYEVLGARLATRSGMVFPTYLREAVLEPLGMLGASLAGSGSPAHGLVGTLDDLMALGAELAAPTLVDVSTWEHCRSVAFPGLDGVLPGFGSQAPCDWGLGPEVRGRKSPHWTGARNSPRTYGHFGRAGGFLWVDPEAGAACGVLTDREFGPWAAASWPELSDAVLDELAG